ncbi:MAG: hypothetical protein IPH45_08890 [Bacteroidales bacterium]|nr:hypothetical protein [Bacteroidales bacterium]
MIATGVHYKNVPLKFAFGTVEMIADKVEFDVTVPADKFKVSVDFKVIEKQLPDELQLPDERMPILKMRTSKKQII